MTDPRPLDQELMASAPASAKHVVPASKRGSLLSRYPEMRRVFLKHLARYGNLDSALAHCRITRSMLEDYAGNNPDFQELMMGAMSEHRAKIEEEIYRRAVEGVETVRTYPDGSTTVTRKFSDKLLAMYAARHIEEYRPKVEKREVSGTVEHKHSVVPVDLEKLSPEERKALRTLLSGSPPMEELKQIPVVEVEMRKDGTAEVEESDDAE